MHQFWEPYRGSPSPVNYGTRRNRISSKKEGESDNCDPYRDPLEWWLGIGPDDAACLITLCPQGCHNISVIKSGVQRMQHFWMNTQNGVQHRRMNWRIRSRRKRERERVYFFVLADSKKICCYEVCQAVPARPFVKDLEIGLSSKIIRKRNWIIWLNAEFFKCELL